MLDLIDAVGAASRRDIDLMLLPLLSDELSMPDKTARVSNLRTRMRRSRQIRNTRTQAQLAWMRT